jgi:hypothetical protein
MLVILGGIGAVWIVWQQRASAAPAVASSQAAARWRSVIGTLPREPTAAERRAIRSGGDLGVAEGAMHYASVGSAAGPWGAGIGAAAGAIMGWFK